MKTLQVLLGLGLSTVFILLAFRGPDIHQALAVAGNLLSMKLLPAIGLFYLMMLLRSERWRIIMQPMSPGFFVSLRVFTIAAGAILVIPARLGEFARPLMMGRRGWSRSAVMATVVFERVLDGLSQIGLFLIVIMLLDVSPPIRQGAWLAGILYGGVFVVLLMLRGANGRMPAPITRILKRVPRVATLLDRIINRFVEGLTILSDTPRLLGSILLSALSWLMAVYFMEMMLVVSGIPLEHPLLAAAFIQLVISLGSILPAAPGQVGTFHYFAKIGLMWFGVDNETALGFAVGLHALYILLLILPAALCFPFEWTGSEATSGRETQDDELNDLPEKTGPAAGDEPDDETGRQERLDQ